MESENSPTITPNPEPTPTPIIKPLETKKIQILTIVLVVLLVLSLGTATFLGYQNMQLTKEIAGMKTNQTATIVVSPTPIATSDPTANWKTFNGKTVSFKYPSDFLIKMGSEQYFGGETVIITNPAKSVTLTVYPAILNSFPYGFGNQTTTKNTIKVLFDNKEYNVDEITVDNTQLYVELVNNGKYSFMLGTGYPAGDNNLSSLTDYQRDKNIFLQILSTFKFTQ